MDSKMDSFIQEVRENFEDLSYEMAEVQEQLSQLNASVIILMTQAGLQQEVTNE